MTHRRWLVTGFLVAAIATLSTAKEPVTLAGLKEQAAADGATPDGFAIDGESHTGRRPVA